MDRIDDTKFATRSSIGYQCWEASSQRWRNDPAAIVYFEFAGNSFSPSEIVNLGRAGNRCNGFNHGPVQVSGRWHDKPALLFDKEGDHVALDISDLLESFTMSAWICTTRRTDLLQAVFRSVGDEHGEHHWQVGRDGSLRAGVQKVYSVASPEDAVKIGVWQHLSAVVDRNAGLATYYVNGKEVAQYHFTTEASLVLGPCTIGAWKSSRSSSLSRRFRGRMDEFAIFRRAFSAEEIKSLYQDGSGFDDGR